MTRPQFEEVLHFHGRSFTLRNDRISYTDEAGYHLHPEMELALLRGGGGVRIINGEEEPFGDIDIVFTPGNIPHCWKFDADKCPTDGMIHDMCCQFHPSLLSGLMHLYPEFAPVTNFFTSLRQAICITGLTARYVCDKFDRIMTLPEHRQVLEIIDILSIVYERKEFRTIGMPVTAEVVSSQSKLPLHFIDNLIADNYHRKLTLKEVAHAAGMSPTSFCNVFKRTTSTTFKKYLTDYRMRIALRLLHDTSLNISEIAYRTGYTDAAHFTRAFLANTGKTPSDCRRAMPRH